MTTLSRRIPFALAALALCVAATASAAGQTLLSHKRTCQMTVPANWQIDHLVKSSAYSPDHSMSAVISNSAADTSLALSKQVMEGTYPPKHVFEDSSRRLVYEYQTGTGKFGLYAGVPSRHGDVCGAQISFRKGREALALQIAASIGPAP